MPFLMQLPSNIILASTMVEELEENAFAGRRVTASRDFSYTT